MAPPAQSSSGIRASDGEDADALVSAAASLTELGWHIDEDRMGLEASFLFPNFTKASDFLSLVNIQAKIRNHHPETYNMYTTVYLHWTTHRPRGLSLKDVEMAQWSHEQAMLLRGHYMEDVTSWRKGCVGCEQGPKV